MLAVLARATLRRYKPVVVGVTGSVGKTSTRLAVARVLAAKYRTGTAEKNYNNEIGLPLAILGIRHEGRNMPRWCMALARAVFKLIVRDSRYPEVLVLEYGVDRPGDMDYLARIAPPNVAVVTAVGRIPAHVEFFRDAAEVAAEKSKLITALPPEGHAVLNQDDADVSAMRVGTRADAVSFGTGEHAAVRIMHYNIFVPRDETGTALPKGIMLKLSYRGSEVPVRIDGVCGMPYAYAAAAAAAAGIVLGINLLDIAEALRGYVPPPGRMRLIPGIKHTLALDDTYNASPESVHAALETLAAIPGGRKIAALGDMREIGIYTEQAHRAVGVRAAGFCDMLLCVGPAARFIAEEARAHGMRKNIRHPASDGVFVFDDARAAGRALEPLLREGDIVLVKGSQAMRMERLVEEVMAEPERASELLVRQEEYWTR